MNKIVKKEIDFAGKKLTLETGELAFMSDMAVKATYGDTVIFASVVAAPPIVERGFFPLTVSYEEKLYASGSIKTSRFMKRDGRPTDDAIVTRRLVDHAIRPLFPGDFGDEVQVAITILSLDENAEPEFLAMIATSAALSASKIPWEGPMTSARVGYVDGDYVINPTKEVLHEKSDLDMMVSFAGKDKKFLAVEAEANILPEEKVLGAIEFARDQIDPVLGLISDFAKELNPDDERYVYVSKKVDETLLKEVSEFAKKRVTDILKGGSDKVEAQDEYTAILAEIAAKFEGKYKVVDMQKAFGEVKKEALQHMILDEHKRPDGRKLDEIRPISCSVGLLPRTHGSSLFTRGVTQSLTVATLGSTSLELLIHNMYGEKTKRFIHYYNFPPYASGEVGRLGGFPGGREIGHGVLAERGLRPIIPSQQEFPYTILLVSEILSSSGSSSMAAVCGSTLSLMDAGVPVKDMVAGVGVGLVVDEENPEKYVLMTDLAYLEDAFGFLDFKMTGTRDGVTAMQADIKAKGIEVERLAEIFERSKKGRLQVLDEMQKVLSEPRAEVSKYAPKTEMIKIDPGKIGVVIGGGGRTIKEIQEKTGADIGIEEDGSVFVTAKEEESVQKAVEWIQGVVKDVEAGEIYDGVVEEIVDFGAFVKILPGKTGLLHVSEITHGFVDNVESVLQVGDTIKVKVLEVSRDGKMSLSKRALEPAPAGGVEDGGGMPRPPRPNRSPRGRGRDGGSNGRFDRKNSGYRRR